MVAATRGGHTKAIYHTQSATAQLWELAYGAKADNPAVTSTEHGPCTRCAAYLFNKVLEHIGLSDAHIQDLLAQLSQILLAGRPGAQLGQNGLSTDVCVTQAACCALEAC